MVYPPAAPYDEGYLKVSDLHTLYYFQAGNPSGKPVVFLHGGPGGTISDQSTIYFNPEIYRIVAFNQRGAGKSTPHCELHENTTQHLVEDIEKIRKHLRIDKWMVFGGSWGSTLGLAYAETYPSPVTALILRGIFLGRASEMEWFNSGARHIFPEAWDKFDSFLPCSEPGLARARLYQERLHSPDHKTRLDAAIAWNAWGSAISRFRQAAPPAEPEPIDENQEMCHAMLESYYTTTLCFLEDGELIRKENIDKIRHIPCIIIQGRYDCICPARSAWDLKLAWPEAEFQWVADAGHTAGEPALRDALVEAADKLSSA